MAIALGGNILLEGFDGLDFTELIVVKKIVGQYARRITDAHGEFSRLSVTRTERDGAHVIMCALRLGETTHDASADAHNLYMALDDALKRLDANLAK